MKTAFATEAERGEPVHRREQARFLLEVQNRPQEALSVALDNWAVQREPDDALILVNAARAAGASQRRRAGVGVCPHAGAARCAHPAAAAHMR